MLQILSFNCCKCVKFQVLSNSVAVVLDSYGAEYAETATFVRLTNSFFDCLNGRYNNQDKATKNLDLAPYTSPEDPRFQVIKKDSSMYSIIYSLLIQVF